MCSSFAVFRHRRAIQKSRGSKVRRAEGTMESEPETPAATANSTGTLVSTTTTTPASSSSTTTSSNTTASGVGTTSHTTTTAPTTSTSTSSSSGGGSSTNISSTSSSTTTTATTSTGRLAVPQISVYSGMPDRQAVQVSLLTMWRSASLQSHPHHVEGSTLWFADCCLLRHNPKMLLICLAVHCHRQRVRILMVI